MVMVSASKRRQIKHLSFPSLDFSAWHDFGLSYYYLLKISKTLQQHCLNPARQQMMWVFVFAHNMVRIAGAAEGFYWILTYWLGCTHDHKSLYWLG